MASCVLLLVVAFVPGTAQSKSDTQLTTELQHHLNTMKKDRQVLRFINAHRWLLKDPRFAANARKQLRIHTASLAHTKKLAVAAKRRLERHAKARQLAAVRSAGPAEAIRRVFGKYWQQAIQVSRCESGLQTTAQNGQYLGLFQMGSYARALYGHGPTAYQQAKAAHAYFVDSGYGWGPWSCKPWS
jgi:hypothetical protein